MNHESTKSWVLILEPDDKNSQKLSNFLKEALLCVDRIKKVGAVIPRLQKREYAVMILSDCIEKEALFSLLTSLKEEDLNPPPCVLCSDSNDHQFIRRAISAGVSAVLPRKSSFSELNRVLNDCKRVQKSEGLLRMLMKIDFFEEFSEEELAALLKVTLMRRFEAGEEILQKGDEAKSFFILVKGKILVIIAKHNQKVIEVSLGEGEPFGEMAILDDSPRSAWCVAAEDCMVMEIGACIIHDTQFALRQKLFARLAVIMAKRIRIANELLDQQIRSQELGDLSDQAAAVCSQGVADSGENESEVFDEEMIQDSLLQEKEASDAEENGAAAKEEDASKEENPFLIPSAVANSYHERVTRNEEYDVLTRKIALRSDFILAKIPSSISEMIGKKMRGYWTGSKLSRLNPHCVWNDALFTPGTGRLLKSLHMIVVCPEGDIAYKESYLNLPLSHRVVGLSRFGCAGTFLGNPEAIDRYLQDDCLQRAIQFDLQIPIDRVWRGEDVVEYLTHTTQDVRAHTLFLIFEDQKGDYTRRFREKFPKHQIVTVVNGCGFNFSDTKSIFTSTEASLIETKDIVPKSKYQGKGFYMGQTFFLADLTSFYSQVISIRNSGYIFGTMGALARMGPDLSGMIWGSRGGSQGAEKAAKVMFGAKGPESAVDVAKAVNWADGEYP